MLRALAKDPHRRFTSAGTFGVALRDAAHGIHNVAELAAEIPRTAFSTEAPTRNWTNDDVPDRIRSNRNERGTGPAAKRAARARATIGDAIIRGDVCDIADGYLELARILVDDRRLRAAVSELEEASDVLTSPGIERHQAIPLWPILLTLAAVHDGLGERSQACTAGRMAREDAARAGSSLGVAQATTLLARLEPRA